MTETVLRHAGRISEVYFAWGEFSTGRGKLKSGLDQENTAAALKQFQRSGIGLNWLLNAECYGARNLEREFFNEIGDTLEQLAADYGVSCVTVSSPVIAKFLKQNFPGIARRASVNLGIGDISAFEMVAELFNGFCLKREYNRNPEKLYAARKWCNVHGKHLTMLANSGCLNECPVRHFHDSLVAHEEEIALRDNGFGFGGLCREHLRKSGSVTFFRDTNFVRPEDIHYYEGLFDMVKLATRSNPDPCGVIEAYLAGSYKGNLPALLEPDHSAELFPMILKNEKLPSDFGTLRQRSVSPEQSFEWFKQCGENINAYL